MVERRMRKTHNFSIGSLWYSAWVDAGSTNFRWNEKFTEAPFTEENKN